MKIWTNIKATKMGPSILCDKSTVQALAATNLELLHNYVSIVVPPVLVLEILGDLAKEPSEGGPSFVKSMAKRLARSNSIPTLDCRILILQELQGKRVEMKYRPIVAGNVVETASGDQGMITMNDPNEELLNRWRIGDFSDIEALASQFWRLRKQNINWRDALAGLTGLYSANLKPKTSLTDTLDLVDDILAYADSAILVDWLYSDLCLLGSPSLPNIPIRQLTELPYTRYCLRIAIFSLFAMQFNLVGQKEDNPIDLEYLFYLPFCNTFSANDRFPKTISKYFLTEHQQFLECEGLRQDLKNIQSHLDSLSPTDKQVEMQSIGPPELPESIVHQLWNRYVRPGYKHQKRLALTPELEQALLKKMKTMSSGTPTTHSIGPEDFDKLDFVMRNRSLLVTDPCPCRSGRAYKDCHGHK